MVSPKLEQILNARSHNNTLCEILREIHDIGMDMGNGEVTCRAEAALVKAKKMDARLKAYRADADRRGVRV